MLYVHPSRQPDLRAPEKIVAEPDIPLTDFTDLYGNRCARVLAPAGEIRFSLETFIEDSGQPDEQQPGAIQHAARRLLGAGGTLDLARIGAPPVACAP
jgi:hypothetical protein